MVGTDERGTPIRIRDVAEVTIGGNIRRGLVELDGRGEVVGGIVIMRSGQNALDVISRVKDKLKEVEKVKEEQPGQRRADGRRPWRAKAWRWARRGAERGLRACEVFSMSLSTDD